MAEEKPKKSAKRVLIENRKDVAKALEILFAAGYVDRKTLYLENFIRGIVFGAGGVIGATLLIGILAWILSLFDQIPLIGPFLDETRQTIEQNRAVE